MVEYSNSVEKKVTKNWQKVLLFNLVSACDHRNRNKDTKSKDPGH